MRICLTIICAGWGFVNAYAGPMSACGCYKTEVVTVVDFVKNNSIVSHELMCKEGYFITGIRQDPEKDPQNNGQFIITSQLNCCQVCATPPKGKVKAK